MNPWAKAFLGQARSDFAAADLLRNSGNHVSQTTMLLWMAWEKLAKALLTEPTGSQPSELTHAVAEKFLNMVPRIYDVIGDSLHLNVDEATARAQALQFSLSELEKLLPRRRDTAAQNMEYPWAPSEGDVKWPARDLPDRFCSTGGTDRYLWKDFASIAASLDGSAELS